MTKRSVVAQCEIVTSDRNAPMEFTGRYDEQGNPVLLKKLYSIVTGSVFEMDDGDPDFHPFLAKEVIRLATPEDLHGRSL